MHLIILLFDMWYFLSLVMFTLWQVFAFTLVATPLDVMLATVHRSLVLAGQCHLSHFRASFLDIMFCALSMLQSTC